MSKLRLAPKLRNYPLLRGTKRSRNKRLRLPRRFAPRNDNLLYEIATLPLVARNDKRGTAAQYPKKKPSSRFLGKRASSFCFNFSLEDKLQSDTSREWRIKCHCLQESRISNIAYSSSSGIKCRSLSIYLRCGIVVSPTSQPFIISQNS